jgi:hypothetical protein
MNPLHWKREHQRALIIVALVGTIAGVLFGYIHSPYFAIVGPGQAFGAWLSRPALYWAWPLFGFIGSGVVFYGIQLFRTSN